MKKIGLLFAAFLFCFCATAQKYDNAFGVRAGVSGGFTFRHVFNAQEIKMTALEVIAGTGYGAYNGSALSVMYEFQREFHLTNSRHSGGIYYYAGFGGHVGHYNAFDYKMSNGLWYTQDVYTVGVDGVLGAEYVFASFPIAAGLDVHPFYNIVNASNSFFDAAIIVRIVF
ncbi:MAG: hypothetical protein KKA07_01400 [Bacteroidetes bacterium]|nr:hypothetical protein [Bacteroidota bacterium]MBU1717705.1 hypothetical protein [Bacteroidota bacterium]